MAIRVSDKIEIGLPGPLEFLLYLVPAVLLFYVFSFAGIDISAIFIWFLAVWVFVILANMFQGFEQMFGIHISEKVENLIQPYIYTEKK